MNDIVVYGQDAQLATERINRFIDDTREDIINSRSKATQTAYKSDLMDYYEFIKKFNLQDHIWDVDSLKSYIKFSIGSDDPDDDLYYDSPKLKITTIERRLAAITFFCKKNNINNPASDEIIKTIMDGMKRTKGIAPDRVKPLQSSEITKIIYLMPKTLKATRDKAILLLGMSAMLRRSEIAALNVKDIEIEEAGMKIKIRRSKTNQYGDDDVRGVVRGNNPDVCPVNALEQWINAANLNPDDPLFVSFGRYGHLKGKNRINKQAIAMMIKSKVKLIGLNPDDYSGHSLRAGGATEASERGAPDYAIKKQGNWKSDAYQIYIRSGKLYHNNASSYMGL
jgi:integrase